MPSSGRDCFAALRVGQTGSDRSARFTGDDHHPQIYALGILAALSRAAIDDLSLWRLKVVLCLDLQIMIGELLN